MRILDLGSDRAIENICIFLTTDEAQQLLASLEDLVAGEAGHHVHVPDAMYKREVTLTIYGDNNLAEFDDRSRRLIIDGI